MRGLLSLIGLVILLLFLFGIIYDLASHLARGNTLLFILIVLGVLVFWFGALFERPPAPEAKPDEEKKRLLP